MNKIIKVFAKSTIITSLFLLALGLLLIFNSDDTIRAVTYVIGAVLIALGVVAIINFIRSRDDLHQLDIIYGIVTIILGVLVIQNPDVIEKLLPFVVGIGIIITSGTKLKYALDLREIKEPVWKYTLIVAVISAVLGVILIFKSEIIVEIIGIVISIYAVLDIISTAFLITKFNKKKNKKTKEAEIVKIEEGDKDE